MPTHTDDGLHGDGDRYVGLVPDRADPRADRSFAAGRASAAEALKGAAIARARELMAAAVAATGEPVPELWVWCRSSSMGGGPRWWRVCPTADKVPVRLPDGGYAVVEASTIRHFEQPEYSSDPAARRRTAAEDRSAAYAVVGCPAAWVSVVTADSLPTETPCAEALARIAIEERLGDRPHRGGRKGPPAADWLDWGRKANRILAEFGLPSAYTE